jgi:FtsZ-binding cell division protein ZapB
MNPLTTTDSIKEKSSWLAQHARAVVLAQVGLATISILLFLFLGANVTTLLKERNKLSAEVRLLAAEKKNLEEERGRLKDEEAALYRRFNAAQAESLGGAVAPKVRVQKTGDPVHPFRFTISMEGSDQVERRIQLVRYDLSTSPRIPNVKTSTSRESGFAVTFDSVGCLKGVAIEAFTSERHSETFFVDLCDAVDKALRGQASK